MKEAVTLAPGFEEFTAVAAQMNYMINDLRSKEVLNLQHGDLEKLIAKNGNELCCYFFGPISMDESKRKLFLSQ